MTRDLSFRNLVDGENKAVYSRLLPFPVESSVGNVPISNCILLICGRQFFQY